MQTIIMDLYNAQLPKDKDWFRKTREDRFGAPLEKVSSLSLQDQDLVLLKVCVAGAANFSLIVSPEE